MATYKTPGVYIEEIPKLPPSIAEVETAIPAFIGYTQVTNKDVNGIHPLRITSMLEYETAFGTAEAANVIVNITDNADGTRTTTAKLDGAAPKNTMYYHLQMYFANGGGPCYIVSVETAANAVTKADLLAGLTAIADYDEPTLLVFPEGTNLAAAGDLYDIYDLALKQAAELKDRFVIMDCHGDDSATLRDATTGIGNNNLKYGAAYHPFLKTSVSYVSSDAKTKVSLNNGTAVLLGTITDNVVFNLAKHAASSVRPTLNPSATVAGVYASVDSTRGVWKAPANVSLNYVSGPTKAVSEEEQAGLNVDTVAGKSINAIRLFTGKGTLVWGARTLAGNDNEWRYVPVRRFFNMVEESTKKATGAFVFESNDANTWVKIQSMIENYLVTLWRAGALQGAKPEHAFYVAVGLGKTMTAQDILEGRMYVEIGMAVVRPAEFIILRFSHMLAQS